VTRIRAAKDEDVAELVRIINRAYAVEAYFKTGDRANAAEVRALLAQDAFLVIDASPEGSPGGAPSTRAGHAGQAGHAGHEGHAGQASLAAAVHVAIRGERGYFGMLSVDPAHQGRGLARRLIQAAESYARGRGCHAMDIHVLSLRTELPPLYRKFGYEVTGTRPFQTSFRPGYESHLLVMSKPL
jgi:ribosomal protein S18 acetylase RimI-like enzyme